MAGSDADNNATTSTGPVGFKGLPDALRDATATNYDEDVTGSLPRTQTVGDIAARTQAPARRAARKAGGVVWSGMVFIPTQQQSAWLVGV